LADSPEFRTAVGTARACVEHPERSGFATRLDADRATRDLDAKAGEKKWEAARQVVLSYARGQQAAARCIADLKTLSRQRRGTPNDQIAMRINADGLYQSWLTENQFELRLALRLLDRNIASAQESLPYSYVPPARPRP
jgi:hypothetical protein